MTAVARRGRSGLVAAALVIAAVLPGGQPARADTVRDAQWHLDFLKVAQAHRITRGAGVTVALLDSGVDASHPDLAGAVLPGTDVTRVPAGRRDGRTDTNGHGTSMAGLIAARGRGGGRGALGIAPAAKVLPVRDRTVSFGSAETAAAIRWAVAHGADVISMSYGGTAESDEDREAIQAALRADVVVVAAVGNTPRAQQVDYPAAYSGVLAVAGVDRAGRHAAVSVTGPPVQIAAPAVDIVSTAPRGGTGYGKGTGTSDATAIVAGAAALVRAKYPRASAAEVVHRLTATARDAGPPGRDEQYGYGVLDLIAALTADVPPMASTPPPVSAPASLAAPALRGGPQASADRSGPPLGLVLAGLAWLLLLVAAAGTTVWLLLRRRQA